MVSTAITTITLAEMVYSILKKHARGRYINDDIYMSFSVEMDYSNREKRLFIDEKKTKHFKPIGGSIIDEDIINMINKEYKTNVSSVKQRTTKDLSFVLKEPRSIKGKIVNKIKNATKIVQENITREKLVKNIIRECKEEAGVALSGRDFEDSIRVSVEMRRYKGGILRMHVYYILSLRKESYKKLESSEKISLISDASRHDGITVSDLKDIFTNSSVVKINSQID